MKLMPSFSSVIITGTRLLFTLIHVLVVRSVHYILVPHEPRLEEVHINTVVEERIREDKAAQMMGMKKKVGRFIIESRTVTAPDLFF